MRAFFIRRDKMKLTSGQVKRLRAEGHRLKLKPVVIIGQKGLSENLHQEIDSALDHHELLKSFTAPTRKPTASPQSSAPDSK
jgi:RNA-binding protein YhbY